MADGYHSDYHKFIKETVPRFLSKIHILTYGAQRSRSSATRAIASTRNRLFLANIHDLQYREFLENRVSTAVGKNKCCLEENEGSLDRPCSRVENTFNCTSQPIWFVFLNTRAVKVLDQFTVILAVFLSIIMGYVLLKTYYDWRKRKNYIVLDGHNKC